jgi:8-oxo-dGTP diphosphatase
MYTTLKRHQLVDLFHEKDKILERKFIMGAPKYKLVQRRPKGYTGPILVSTTSDDPKGLNVTPFPIPQLTVTVAIFHESNVLLGLRKNDPYSDMWCLPGGFMNPGESFLDTAIREVKEETGVDITANQLTLVSQRFSIGIDPRGWVVDHGYAINLTGAPSLCAGDDIGQVRWSPIDEIPELAFDHKKILQHALYAAGLKQIPFSSKHKYQSSSIFIPITL